MAGGAKQGPRQRMIGMMYLVLTAMLALQVKNTVLDKFIDIDDSLQHSISESRKDNQKIINGMKKAIEKRGNKAEDRAVLQKAEEVIEETSTVMTSIKALREEIIEASGGYDEEGHYKNLEEEEAIMNLVLGNADSKSGKGYELERMLNAYVAKMQSYDKGLEIEKIALGASEIARYQGVDGQETKDFAQINFEETPMVAALAVLSDMQNKVARVESKALAVLSEKVGAKDLIFDKIVAVVAPESRYVTAGTPYKANVFVAAYSSTANPEMSSNMGTIKVGDNGSGAIQFVASANDYDELGQAKRRWTGEIKVATPKGDTILTIDETYTVVKPTLKVTADAVKALYLNCGNVLNIQVPELGAAYNPKFEVTGGTVQESSERGVVTISPNAARVSVTVKNNGAVIGTEKFRVKPIPLPTVKLFSNNREVNIRKGGAMLRRLELRAIPDRDFAAFLPRDARYRVTEYEVILARGTNEVMSRTIKKPNANLRDFAERARRGDRLVIDVKKVERLNHRNQRERVKVGLLTFSYNITVE
ncbi:MAG: gliding motility protein GldM [Flammeovirgaceae bacterium]